MTVGHSVTSVVPSVTEAGGPELVIGLVTPIGSGSNEIVRRIRDGLRAYCNYEVEVGKISRYLNKSSEPAQLDEYEDHRIRRLIEAGNKFCRDHNNDPGAVAKLACGQIFLTRQNLAQVRNSSAISRQAYIVDSLKRLNEVALLRHVYDTHFLLVGCQASFEERIANLCKENMSVTEDVEKLKVARELMQLDANEDDKLGQKVNDTFAVSDYFLGINEDLGRLTRLYFGDPTCPPTFAEYAMYVAYATSARSLSPGRRVGASIARDGSILATGFNDVPGDEMPDVTIGSDASEQYKRGLVADTLTRVAPMLSEEFRAGGGLAEALKYLEGSEILSVIEGQRAVHAEGAAIGDAAKRGIAVAGADLYCTTLPCHLCFKAAIDAGIRRVYYIEPYAKSRAAKMYPKNIDKLVPYEGLAPRLFMQVFKERSIPKADEFGNFPNIDPREGWPRLVDKETVYLQREAEQMILTPEGS